VRRSDFAPQIPARQMGILHAPSQWDIALEMDYRLYFQLDAMLTIEALSQKQI
jgi:hypothetical protein